MKKSARLISITATLQLAVCWTASSFASEPDKAVVRTVYAAQATPAIAKSVGLLSRIAEGDRFAVVQLANGTWGLALLASGAGPVPLDKIALPRPGQAAPIGAGEVKLVHLLNPSRGAGSEASYLAEAQP
ncbi:MAG: hypothetical protein PHS32_12535 [Rhodoferax sp.]|uniref:hypothetical protein n=1 Tax=Rhodoferax sp. TaxID=50421 RepID=UPI00262EEA01|nr:hypothetical protein [Rhodoferax sp.]MDD5334559.1 hypothetical protein [Rhodoferax sp.]